MVRAFLFALLLNVILFSIFSSPANADVLFEGYSKILSGDQHIGYIVSRYEFDQKKKQFISTYFLKTGKGPSEVSESLHAIADSELAPISYEYTTLANKEAKTVDAKFKGSSMSAVITNAGKVQKIEKKIPKGTFLSTFLVYLMLKSQEGLQAETKYEYQAIAEEDGGIYKGQALVGKEEEFNGFKAFKVLNTFKDLKFLSYINGQGEVLGTSALGQGIKTELVSNQNEALAGQTTSNMILKTLFGAVPLGEKNLVAQSLKNKKPGK